jgi:magnesium-transporting ATPase (P-type)
VGLYNDKRTNEKETSDAVEAHFYYEGITNMHFNLGVFWGWVLSSALHGTSILVMLMTQHASTGSEFELLAQSTLCFTMVMHVTTYKLFVSLNYVSWRVIIISILILIGYYVMLIIVGIPFLANLVEREINSLPMRLITEPFVLIMIVTGSFLPLIFDLCLRKMYELCCTKEVTGRQAI